MQNIKNQIFELEKYLHISNELNTLLNKKKLKASELYDTVYYKKQLEIMSKQDIENISIKENISKLISSLDMMLSTYSDKDIDTILKRSTLLKLEDRQNKFSGLEDNVEVYKHNELKAYFKKVSINLIMISLLTLFIISGTPVKFTHSIVKEVSNIVLEDGTVQDGNVQVETVQDGNVQVETVQDGNVQVETVLDNLFTEDLQPTNQALEKISFLVRLMVSMVTVMVLTCIMYRIAIDLMHLTFPSARGLIDRFTSKEAKEVQELEVSSSINSVDTLNRIEVAVALLNNMTEYVMNEGYYAVDKTTKEIIKYRTSRELKNIQGTNYFTSTQVMDDLNQLRDKLNSGEGITRIENYVNIELYYEFIKDLLQKDDKWLIKHE